jgi:hypothetical protein
MSVSVSLSDVHAHMWPALTRLIAAIGLSTSSPLPTNQSSAFFNTQGIP